MRYATTLLLAFAMTATAAAAQELPMTPKLEVRPLAGALIPTGVQRNQMASTVLYGAQAAVEMTPWVHAVASFAWSPARHRIQQLTDRRVNLFQYDLGAEFHLIQPLGENWRMKPFIGVGGGARTYDYREPGTSTRTYGAGYAALGTEFEYGITAFRLEARDYVYGWEDPITASSKTRNDVALTAGVAFQFGLRR